MSNIFSRSFWPIVILPSSSRGKRKKKRFFAVPINTATALTAGSNCVVEVVNILKHSERLFLTADKLLS